MDWNDFEAARLKMIGNEPPELLTMSGEVFDNQTSYLEKQKGTELTNSEADLFVDEHDGVAFVWLGSTVRVLSGLESGGHPALAGFKDVYCAGEIHKDYFFFKSGHYKPQVINATHFLFDFVAKSCANLVGGPRDAAVHRLCRVRHQFYVDRSSTQTFWSTLAQLIADATGRSTAKPSTGGVALATQLGSSARPAVIRQTHYEAKAIVFAPMLRPIWQLDSDATRCFRCKKEFGPLRWRHHCRACGYVVCDGCSNRKRIVDMPATRPGEKDVARSTEAVRVCSAC